VVAPGGDATLQLTAAAPNGRVPVDVAGVLAHGHLPAATAARRRVGSDLLHQQGTSMASPHVAGVAALILSQASFSPGAVGARITSTADPLACPSDPSIYDPFPALDNGAPQECQGGAGYNSFNGHGQVNALNAISGH